MKVLELKDVKKTFQKNKKTLYQIYFNIYNISSYKVFYFV